MSRPLPLLLSGVVFALLATLSNGLVLGLADHGISEVFVGGSGVFPRDLLDGAAARHPSVLWGTLRTLRLLVPAPPLSHALHLLALTATGAALHALVTALRPDGARWAPWLALGLVAPAHVLLGGAPTLDPLLLPRGVALPVELAAFALLAHRRPRAALLLAGLAVPLHAPSALPTLAAIAFAAWRDPMGRGRLRALDWLLPLLPGLLVAVALWSAAGPSWVASLLPASPDVRAIVAARLTHHLHPLAAGGADLVVLAALGVLGGLALRSVPSSAARRSQSLLAALLGWTVLMGAACSLLAVPLLWNLEPWQASRLVACLVACCLAASAARGLALLGALSLLALSWGTAAPRWWAPHGAEGDEAALAAWARTSTEPGDLFVLPPDGLEGFRVQAQRPVFALWKDGGEAQFDPDFARLWASRMESLCRCAPFEGPLPHESRRGGRAGTLAARVGHGYDAAPDALLAGVARGAGARWLVRRAGPIPARLEGRLPAARVGAFAIYAVEAAPVELPDPPRRR